MPTERRTIYFSGRVQGIGFRYTAVQFARDLPLSGTVRNVRDGRVELILEVRPPRSTNSSPACANTSPILFVRSSRAATRPRGFPRGFTSSINPYPRVRW